MTDDQLSESSCAPSLAVEKGILYLSLIDPNNNLVSLVETDGGIEGWGGYVPKEADGSNWYTSASAALVVHNGQLYVAMVGNDRRERVMVGQVLPQGADQHTTIEPRWSWVAPAITTYLGKLWIAFPGFDDVVSVLSSEDGKSWSPVRFLNSTGPENPPNVHSSLSFAVHNQQLWIAYREDNVVVIRNSLDGTFWSDPVVVVADGYKQLHGAGPSLTSFNSKLFLALTVITDAGGTDIVICSSTDGTKWDQVPLNLRTDARLYAYTIQSAGSPSSTVYFYSTGAVTPPSFQRAASPSFRVFKYAAENAVPVYQYTIPMKDRNPNPTLAYRYSRDSTPPAGSVGQQVAFYAFPDAKGRLGVIWGLVPVYEFTNIATDGITIYYYSSKDDQPSGYKKAENASPSFWAVPINTFSLPTVE